MRIAHVTKDYLYKPLFWFTINIMERSIKMELCWLLELISFARAVAWSPMLSDHPFEILSTVIRSALNTDGYLLSRGV